MNLPLSPRILRHACACFSLLTTAALAQTAATAPATSSSPAKEDEVITLSPFVVSADSQTGWVATETLAGSRLRTDFKDVPNQIETLTKDFMRDLALNNVGDAMIYSTNSENQNEFMTSTTSNQTFYPTQIGRIRGLGGGTTAGGISATVSRNFFQVHNLTDNFNLERATIASGPNSILFGLGSPAGIIDATPARANIQKNSYGFQLQYDSENSRRATFDANLAMIPGKLGLRIMGLGQKQYTAKKPNLDEDKRLYGALTVKPFTNTTLVLQLEHQDRNFNRAGRIVPYDNVTLWLNGGKPAYANANTTTPATFPAIPSTQTGIFARAGNQAVFVNGGSVDTRNWNNSVVVKNPSTQSGIDPTFDNFNYTLLDKAVYPFDENLFGMARSTLLGGQTHTAILEQKLANNLYLELAYNFEHAYDHRVNAGAAGPGGDPTLNVDANTYIPGTLTPNPNYGKYYVQGGTANEIQYYDRRDFRATLSYEYDFAQQHRDGWLRWLGRHRLAGLYTAGTAEFKGQLGFGRKILDNPVIPGLTLTPKTTQNWADNATRQLQFRHYLDTPVEAGAPFEGDFTLNDSLGNPYTLYLYDTPLVASNGKRLGSGQVASGSLNKSSATIFAWQNYLLKDRLVLTYGWRKDTANSATLDVASSTRDFSGLFPVLWDTTFDAYGPSQAGVNRSFGVVGHVFKWLSLSYNQSTTFDLNIGRYDPFGNDIPGAAGKGKDYGVRFDFLDNKVSLKINKYENDAAPQRASNQINIFRDIFFNLEQAVLRLDPATPTINTVDGNKRGFRVLGRPNYFIMSDLTASGYEVELNLRPTPNWDIRINGAKSEATEANIGLPWFDWTAARLPVWSAVVAKNGELGADGQPATWKTALIDIANPTSLTLEQYYNSELVGRAFSFMQAADGRATDGARSIRANVITNYRFLEGRLKGFNVGGAVRWRGAPTIGYGTKTSSTGTVIYDLDKVYRGQRELYVDLLAGYKGRMKAFGGFNYNLQLNVRNALNEDDAVPVASTTKGQIVKLATVEPRVWILSFGVEF